MIYLDPISVTQGDPFTTNIAWVPESGTTNMAGWSGIVRVVKTTFGDVIGEWPVDVSVAGTITVSFPDTSFFPSLPRIGSFVTCTYEITITGPGGAVEILQGSVAVAGRAIGTATAGGCYVSGDPLADVEAARQAAVSTAADRVQTGLDRAQTEADAAATADDAAATAADRVQTTADRVQTMADAAATAVDAAAVAADRVLAEAAREGAVLAAASVGFYADTTLAAAKTAGLAVTTEGQTFHATGADVDYVGVYKDVSGVDVEQARYPTASAIDPLQRTNSAIFAVADADGNLGVDVQSPLRIDTSGGVETTALHAAFAPVKWLWALSDDDGNIPFGVDHFGRLVADFSLVPSANAAPKTGGLYDYTVNHVFSYGQSLSVGQALPIQSGTPKYDHLMFYRGMVPQYSYSGETPATWYQSLVPAVEAVSAALPVLGETPCRGAADAIKERIAAEDGKTYSDHEYRLLLSAPGYGATTIAQLAKGTAHFARMVEQASYGLSLANAAGDTYAVQAVTWIQGESDYLAGTTRSAYLSALNMLVADIQTDLKAVTGQSKRIAVIGYQVASHINGASDDIPDIALAQLECAEENANFFVATPMYHFPYADGFHLTGPGSQWLGAYLGLAYKRIVIDGEDWSPLRPIASVRQGGIVEVRFHVPKGRLAFDTTTVADQPSKGFQLVDSGGSALTISNVEIVDFDRVRITAAASIPSGAKLRYAWQGNTAIGLGNLRDTQGEFIAFDPEGVNRPLHNWCVIFERSL